MGPKAGESVAPHVAGLGLPDLGLLTNMRNLFDARAVAAQGSGWG